MSGGADRSILSPPRDARRPSPLSVFRIADWWHFKLTPPLALFLATLITVGEPLMPRWLDMVLLVAGIAICAGFVSLINDYFDREEDARSGKANRVAALSSGVARTMFFLVVATGAGIAFAWRGEPLALLFYGMSWIAFTAYSAPPLRLKTRGLPGVFADACGSTVFPVLLAVVLAGRSGDAGTDIALMAAAAAWGAGWGMRCILWHQAIDAGRDRRGSVRTFVQRRGARAARLLVLRVAVPLELAGLLSLFVMISSVVPAIFLALYLGVVAGRSKLWAPLKNRPLLLGEYYDGLLPLAMIAASALRYPADLFLLIPYFVLFGRRPFTVLYHAFALIWGMSKRGGLRIAYLAFSSARRRFRSS
jgi:1,4-dihydroxy-2-naphthoate octaprenyltransferase